MSDYKILSSQIDYECPWFKVFKEKVQYPHGGTNDYYSVDRGYDYVCIVPQLGDKIIVNKQWRPPVKDYFYEFPIGGMDAGETPLESAQRELMEETGYQSKNWHNLGEAYLGAGLATQKGHYFLATDLEEVKDGKENNPHEIVENYQLSLEKIYQMIKDGQFQDGPGITALTLYNIFKNKL